jgi:phenylacetate-coenzyme A ligase PaaK-like adenylate-forming protein
VGDEAGSSVTVGPASYDTLPEELARRLTRVEEIEPMPLADLFQMTFSTGPLGARIFAVLQRFLLTRTLKHAASHTSYYRTAGDYAGASTLLEAAGSLTPFRGLPTIDRKAVVENFNGFLADDVQLRSVCHTSGTTGQPLEIYKSFEEVTFLNRFFARLFAPAFASSTRPLTLSFPTPHHGVPIPMPSPGISFAGGVTDDTLIRDAVRVLEARYVVPGHQDRISILSGMAFQILFFTSFLLEQGIDPHAFGLSSVNVAGGFVPRHWREFLERAWGCQVNDRFSMTETVGGASRCSTCGWFRPDPQVFFELVDFDTRQHIREGIGRLVVTNLYPFVQMVPLIRYETGDLACCRSCECSPTPVFCFLGRAENGISRKVGSRRQWLIFSAALHEVLATIPDLNVYEWFSNVRMVKDRRIGSLPIVSLKSEYSGNQKLNIVLAAELRYAPKCYPGRTREIAEAIRKHLEHVDGAEFADALQSGEVTFDVSFLPPGGLKDPYVIKI